MAAPTASLHFDAALLRALAVGAVTATTGIIGFIGLVAPVFARRLTGGHPGRAILPAALIGALLLIGLYQLLHSRIPEHAAIGETVGCAGALKKPWAKGLLNAVLRRAYRETPVPPTDPAQRHSHPAWLLARLAAAWPAEPRV